MMRLAGLILGIISSVLGLLSAIFFVTGLSLMSVNEVTITGGIEISKSTILILSWLSVLCFAIGLVGACLIKIYPRITGDIIIGISIIGFLFFAQTYFMYVMYGLMFISGIFAIRGAREIKTQSDNDREDLNTNNNEIIENIDEENNKNVSLLKMLINPKKH